MKKFHSYVGKNPGQRIEQIGIGLGVSAKTLVLRLRKLVGEKRIGMKGHKRGTTYVAR